MQKPRHPPHGRASAAEQRWVTTTSEELAFCCCVVVVLVQFLPESPRRVCWFCRGGRIPGGARARIRERRSRGESVGPCRDCPLLSSSDNANTWPKVESPCRQSGKDRRHFGVPCEECAGGPAHLERTCSRRCVQFISATAANAGRESGDEYHGADHHRPLRRRGRTSDQQQETNKRPPRRRGDARRGLSLAGERSPESSPSIPRAVPSF